MGSSCFVQILSSLEVASISRAPVPLTGLSHTTVSKHKGSWEMMSTGVCKKRGMQRGAVSVPQALGSEPRVGAKQPVVKKGSRRGTHVEWIRKERDKVLPK